MRHEPTGMGRAYRYHPTVKAEHAGGSALARIRDAMFQGSVERMFAQLVADRRLRREDLGRMRGLLAERLKERPFEQGFGWQKCIGTLRKPRHRGQAKVSWIFAFTCAAYSLVRMRTLLVEAPA